MSFKSNINELLEEKRVTTSELAKRSGVTRQGIFKARQDQHIGSCQLSTLGRIAFALGVPVCRVFSEEWKSSQDKMEDQRLIKDQPPTEEHGEKDHLMLITKAACSLMTSNKELSPNDAVSDAVQTLLQASMVVPSGEEHPHKDGYEEKDLLLLIMEAACTLMSADKELSPSDAVSMAVQTFLHASEVLPGITKSACILMTGNKNLTPKEAVCDALQTFLCACKALPGAKEQLHKLKNWDFNTNPVRKLG